jgi:hypothetical protein
MKKIIKHYPMTDRLIVRRGYRFSKFLIYYFCYLYMSFHACESTIKGSAGRVCHLENVKSYMSYLQQYTKIIKMLTLKTYFSYIWSKLKRTRSQITSNLYVSNWKSSYDVILVMGQSRQWHFAEFFQFTMVCVFTVAQQGT